jgi:hypothetical protein
MIIITIVIFITIMIIITSKSPTFLYEPLSNNTNTAEVPIFAQEFREVVQQHQQQTQGALEYQNRINM